MSSVGTSQILTGALRSRVSFTCFVVRPQKKLKRQKQQWMRYRENRSLSIFVAPLNEKQIRYGKARQASHAISLSQVVPGMPLLSFAAFLCYIEMWGISKSWFGCIPQQQRETDNYWSKASCFQFSIFSKPGLWFHLKFECFHSLRSPVAFQ